MSDDKSQVSSLTSQVSRLKSHVSSLTSQDYEVFRREKAGAPMVHAGSVTADCPELALIYARESFGRRGESHALWVVPRVAVIELDDADILSPALDRGYRTVEGYRMREKLQSVRERLHRTEL